MVFTKKPLLKDGKHTRETISSYFRTGAGKLRLVMKINICGLPREAKR